MNFTAEQWQAIGLSLRVAVMAVLVSLPFGLALAWLLARRQFRGKAVLETLINLPLVLPPVVTGYLLLVTLGRNGWIGQVLDRWFGVQIVFTWKAAALASAIMAFPLMVRSIRLALTQRRCSLGTSGTHAGRGAVGHAVDHHVAAGSAWDHCRLRAGFCPQHRRIRRDDHGLGKHARLAHDSAWRFTTCWSRRAACRRRRGWCSLRSRLRPWPC